MEVVDGDGVVLANKEEIISPNHSIRLHPFSDTHNVIIEISVMIITRSADSNVKCIPIKYINKGGIISAVTIVVNLNSKINISIPTKRVRITLNNNPKNPDAIISSL